MSDINRDVELVRLYGRRATDGERIEEIVASIDQADNEILSLELSASLMDVCGDDGDLGEAEREDLAHEIATARRALRNMARLMLTHAGDLQDLAAEAAKAEQGGGKSDA